MTTVWVTTRFIALHHWDNAPPPVTYLRSPHRHEFHVKLELTVHHDNRDVEIIQLKDWLNTVLTGWTTDFAWALSCEQFAGAIINYVRLHDIYKNHFPVTCSVSEDGENGATVYAEN